jgi:alpha-galactosidase
MTFNLPPHGVAALLLNDAGAEPESLNGTCGLYYQCSVSEVEFTYEVELAC